jgi:hypothetical protein
LVLRLNHETDRRF